MAAPVRAASASRAASVVVPFCTTVKGDRSGLAQQVTQVAFVQVAKWFNSNNLHYAF